MDRCERAAFLEHTGVTLGPEKRFCWSTDEAVARGGEE